MLRKQIPDRRRDRRYDIHLPLHFRASQHGEVSRWASGTTCDLSRGGLSLRCRRQLSVGSRVEMIISWPVLYADVHPIELLATGIVVRAGVTRAALRLTWRQFHVVESRETLGATA